MKKTLLILILASCFLSYGQEPNTTIATALDIGPTILGGTTYNSGTVTTTHDDHDIGTHGIATCEAACCDLLYYKFKPAIPGTLRGDLSVFQPLAGGMLGYKTESADGNVTASDLDYHNSVGNFCGFRDSIQVSITPLEVNKYYYVGVFNHNEQTGQGVDSEITFNFVPDCPGGFNCNVVSETICDQNSYTTTGGYVFTETGSYTEDIGVNRTYYNVTLNSPTEITQDHITDSSVCEDTAILYEAEIHTTAYLEFNKGDDRYIRVDGLQDELNASDRSVFMWIKAPTNVASTSQMLFSINSSSGGNVCNLQLSTSERLQLFDGSSSRNTTATLNDGLWHYVGYTYNNATNEAIVYSDGVEVLTFTNSQDATATSLYSIGQEYDSGPSDSNHYDGLIAEISVWNKVLDVTDISTAMTGKITASHPSFANLVGYYSFIECGQDSAVLKDWSGNNNDGTVIGAVINTANYEEIIDFNAEAWYTKSWQKNDVEFETASTINITPSLGTDTYKINYLRDYISSTDTWDITNNTIAFTSQPTDQSVAPNADATFTSDGGTGVTYQWFNTELGSAVNKTTADGLGSNNCYGVLESNGIIYVANEGGLSISTDGGVTFSNRTTADGLGNNSTRKVYESNGTLYVATASGLSISTDGGNTFTNKTNADGLGTSYTFDVYESNGAIYVATFGGLSISTNGGISFINKTTADGLVDNTCNSVYVSNGTLYVGTSGGLSISTDGGNTYTNNSSLGNCKGVYASNGTLYVASLGGLFISTNGGSSFEHKTETDGLSIIYCNDVYVSSGTIYVANDAGIDISTDGGTSFTNIMTANGFSEDTYGVLESNGTVYGASTQLGLSIITSKSILNGETNANLTLNNVQLTDDGNQYFVEISNANCTTASDIVTLNVSGTLSTVQNNFVNAISIYPNPVKEVLHIENKNALNIKTLRIYNINGKLLHSGNFTTTINMESYTSGLYFIELTSENNEQGTFKILKK